ncbi:hypothetical protein K5D34_11775, partial [Pseudomonas cichorii]|nr:hypothetical protein [Pseudomonas cichorii]
KASLRTLEDSPLPKELSGHKGEWLQRYFQPSDFFICSARDFSSALTSREGDDTVRILTGR